MGYRGQSVQLVRDSLLGINLRSRTGPDHAALSEDWNRLPILVAGLAVGTDYCPAGLPQVWVKGQEWECGAEKCIVPVLGFPVAGTAYRRHQPANAMSVH